MFDKMCLYSILNAERTLSKNCLQLGFSVKSSEILANNSSSLLYKFKFVYLKIIIV